VGDTLRPGASFVGYLLVVVYFAVVLLIGVAARWLPREGRPRGSVAAGHTAVATV
jgi:hypothetical protein